MRFVFPALVTATLVGCFPDPKMVDVDTVEAQDTASGVDTVAADTESVVDTITPDTSEVDTAEVDTVEPDTSPAPDTSVAEDTSGWECEDPSDCDHLVAACVKVLCLEHTCATQPDMGATCDDGDPCTKNDVCAGASCAGTSYACDDGVDCTDDLCDGEGGCDYPAKDGACHIGDACFDVGEVKADDPCRVCVSGEAWSHNDGAACEDGDEVCTLGDVCDAGVCVSGAPPIDTDDWQALTIATTTQSLVYDVAVEGAGHVLAACVYLGDGEIATSPDETTLPDAVGAPDAVVLRRTVAGDLSIRARLQNAGDAVFVGVESAASGSAATAGYFEGPATLFTADGETAIDGLGGEDGIFMSLDPTGAVQRLVVLGGDGDDFVADVELHPMLGWVVAGAFEGVGLAAAFGTTSDLVAEGDFDGFVSRPAVWTTQLKKSGALFDLGMAASATAVSVLYGVESSVEVIPQSGDSLSWSAPDASGYVVRISLDGTGVPTAAVPLFSTTTLPSYRLKTASPFIAIGDANTVAARAFYDSAPYTVLDGGAPSVSTPNNASGLALARHDGAGGLVWTARLDASLLSIPTLSAASADDDETVLLAFAFTGDATAVGASGASISRSAGDARQLGLIAYGVGGEVLWFAALAEGLAPAVVSAALTGDGAITIGTAFGAGDLSIAAGSNPLTGAGAMNGFLATINTNRALECGSAQ